LTIGRGLSDHAIRARLHAGGVSAARTLIDACGAGLERDRGSAGGALAGRPEPPM
jgi:hypothetical protein